MVEERLGVRFPPSLRGFFLASNGWKRVKGWVDLVHPCGDVVWMRDSDAGSDLIRIYGEDPDNDDYVQLFRRCVEVAAGEDFWLLDPTDVRAGRRMGRLSVHAQVRRSGGVFELLRAVPRRVRGHGLIRGRPSDGTAWVGSYVVGGPGAPGSVLRGHVTGL